MSCVRMTSFIVFLRLERNSEELSPAMSAFALNQSKRHVGLVFIAAVALSIFCSSTHLAAQALSPVVTVPKPPDVPAEWKQLIGIYTPEGTKASFLFFEQDQHLYWLDSHGEKKPAFEKDGVVFITDGDDVYIVHIEHRNGSGIVTSFHGNELYVRSDAGADPAGFFRLTPTRSVEELRNEALAASPPQEKGPFRKPELVELTTLDRAIHLDIRYATSNDFLGTPVYTQARAFMQRPAAEALVRALHKLQPLGYGLLIHDAYRPWYVTKIFWDATPPEGKIFVADPKEGSRHNRGCAVDLTLYDLATGKPIEMPGTYDEMSPRSFPDYPGGTSLQRWHRDLLRRAVESEGFTVYEHEWWHFDYKDWREYPILNIKFEDLHSGQGLASAQ
jgi:D-alanyl-D-alanine dipeptidase